MREFDSVLRSGSMAARKCGSVAEWLKAAVLKTADGKLSVSSNLTASAIFKALIYQGFFIFWNRLTLAGRL